MILTTSGIILSACEDTEHARCVATIANPAHEAHRQMQKSGYISPYAAPPPAVLRYVERLPPDILPGAVIVPRYTPGLAKGIDARSGGDRHDFALRATLRPYQDKAVTAFTQAQTGIVCMPCGAGKTTMGLGVIAEVGRRTLILVHDKALGQQWAERIEQQLDGAVIGYRMDGKDSSAGASVVIATIQSLTGPPWADVYRWAASFGLVILDEAHHAPAQTFTQVLLRIPARYRLGLTATPAREDGLTDLLWWSFDRVVYSVTRAELIDGGYVQPARLHTIYTGCRVKTHRVRQGGKWLRVYSEDAASLKNTGRKVSPLPHTVRIQQLTIDARRNALIIDTVRTAVEDGHQVLVLSERVAHCNKLVDILFSQGITAEAIHGKRKAKDVDRILNDARTGKVRVLVGTTKADEGLDVPSLSFGILATPSKKDARITQRIGRLERPGKLQPVWVDMVDSDPSSERGYRKRLRLYRRLGIVGE